MSLADRQPLENISRLGGPTPSRARGRPSPGRRGGLTPRAAQFGSVGGDEGADLFFSWFAGAVRCVRACARALADGRAEGVPVLGRAAAQGDVRGDARVARRVREPEQHARGVGGAAPRRQVRSGPVARGEDEQLGRPCGVEGHEVRDDAAGERG